MIRIRIKNNFVSTLRHSHLKTIRINPNCVYHPVSYTHLNQIRQRPSVGLPPLPSGLSKYQMREAIRLERRWEFAFEGMHLFDTRSYKTTEKDVTKPVYGINAVSYTHLDVYKRQSMNNE